MRLNGSQILCETLIEQGVDTIFGYPGGAVLNIYDALYQYSDRIRHVLTAHEQGASHAADGYARATGKTGVVLATSGPGATNLVTGIATAYIDSVPMVAITGNVGVPLIGKDSFQEVYIAGITMPITKHNFVVNHVEDLADTVREAFRIAQSGRPGPVLIDIPKDVTAAMCEFENKPVQDIEETYDVSEEDFKRIAEEINAAQCPVIYYGGGIVASHACEELVALMHKADIPATGTMMSMGCVPADDPLYLGMIGMHGKVSAGWAVDRADLLLSIGARFSDRVATNTNRFAPDARIIHIDIDAAEINKNMPADDYLVTDARTFLSGVLPYVKETKHDAWRAQIADWVKNLDYKPKDADDCLHPHQIVKMCAELGGDDLIIATDVGQHQMWASQYIEVTEKKLFITSGGLGTMGFGLPSAIGAQIGCPEKRVISISGDGGFQMNLQELATAVTQELPILVVIINNTYLGMVRQWQGLFYNKNYSSTCLRERKS
ncbi:MAG: biosynthetic-type acetolactate synthase large subunit, partial [Butyricicoccus pullicaecorum]|nr:biosynthetic-type acetolactate synthase large subunit [Butyricicoccus pullicaecorum]